MERKGYMSALSPTYLIALWRSPGLKDTLSCVPELVLSYSQNVFPQKCLQLSQKCLHAACICICHLHNENSPSLGINREVQVGLLTKNHMLKKR